VSILEKEQGELIKEMRLFQNSGSFERATLDVYAVFLLFFTI
jgi:hypothetical protein